ncbi:hypothetical protein EOD73_16065 [Inhella crocodyli]|uniref:Translocation and assembly module TamB C-terminal domain-containing protein n=1 Tax=Inhella crocodyli TaxID=2499851 RepID=A0A3S3T4C2_9BURK|nr:hypothetical protein EOD73_16065 [Inhella crocodyli]
MRRGARWAWGLGGGALLAGALLAGAGTAPALTWLASRAGWQLEGAEGNLWTGLQVARVQHRSADLQVDGRDWVLAPWRWRDGALRSDFRADRLRWHSAPSAAPLPTEAQLLRALQTPLPFALDRIAVQALTVQEVPLQGLDAAVQWGGEAAIALQVKHLGWAPADLQAAGELRLGRDGQLSASWRLQGPRARVTLDGRGPLSRWPLRVTLQGGDGAQAQVEAQLQPLASQPLRALQARFAQLDLQALHPQAPHTRWQGTAALAPRDDGALGLQLEADNASARRLDENGWPLRAVRLRAQAHPQHWQQVRIEALQVLLGSERRPAGQLRLAEASAWPADGGAWSVPVLVQGVPLQALDAGWPALQVDGRVQVAQGAGPAAAERPTALTVNLRADALKATARDHAWRLTAEAVLQGATVELRAAELAQQHGPGRVRLAGRWTQAPVGGHGEGQAMVAQWPLPLGAWTARLAGQGEFQLGWQAGAWQGRANWRLDDGAQLAALPLLGHANWTADAQGQRWQAELQIPHEDGPTELAASGARTPPLRTLSTLADAATWWPQALRWRAPNLARLQPLWRPVGTQLSGRTEGQIRLDADGRPTEMQARLAQLRWQAQATDAPVQLAQAQIDLAQDTWQWQVQDLWAQGWHIAQASGQGGRRGPLSWQVDGQAPAAHEGPLSPLWRWEGRTEPPQANAQGWTWPGIRQRLAAVGGATWLQWDQAQARWDADGQGLRLDGGQLALRGDPMSNAVLGLRWQRGRPEVDLQLAGRLQVAPWLAGWQPDAGWQGDLRADLQLALQGPALDLRLARQAGDLRLDGQALGLEKLQLALSRGQAGSASAQLQVESPVLGRLQAQAKVDAPTGPLSGQLRARLPALHLLQAWLPAGLQLRGQAELDANLGGTLAQPRFQGQGELHIDRLQHAASGLGGRNGLARWRFDDHRLELQQWTLQGLGEGDSGGWLRGQGQWAWGQADAGARLSVQAEGFRLLNRFDRQLTTTGHVTLALDGRRLQLRGKVQADQGVFDIGQGDAPSLDEDVRVVRPSVEAKAPTAPSRWQRDVLLQLDLGQRLRVQGRGLASRLTGQLQLQEQGGQAAQWTGRVEMGGGRYKAYGQTLDIESGELRFTGALDNPRLDILALRPDLEVRVGVRATGSAQTPRIRLYSEPDMADNDKLAWLLLGRAPDELGRNDTALLQRAALALLSGEGDNPTTQLMDKLGLTEFSVSNSDDAGTTLRLGAQLSKRWSVGYERSLSAATGSWQLVYRLGQRFRLRAQSGTDSALDALWLWRFD